MTKLSGYLRMAAKIRPRHFQGLLSSPYFGYTQFRTRGMLSPLTYHTLYAAAAALPDVPFVEIGAATGTATIALAKGYEQSEKTSPIFAVEKCEGGSRTDYGTRDQNEELLLHNLETFGVRGHVKCLLVDLNHHGKDSLLEAIGAGRIAGFLHDADGRLDRDFSLLWHRVIRGGLIVIDDYGGAHGFKPPSDRHPDGGVKPYVTKAQLNILMETGHFRPLLQIGHTVFGIKPPEAEGLALPTSALYAAHSEVLHAWSLWLAHHQRRGTPRYPQES